MSFDEHLKNSLILFDGAMGTEIQKLDIQDSEWDGHPGCNEILTLSAPRHIAGIHRSYLEAGADVIETNTFGANRIVLAECAVIHAAHQLNASHASKRHWKMYHGRPTQPAHPGIVEWSDQIA